MVGDAEDNLMVALMETPNFEYLDPNSSAVNKVALLDRETTKVLDAFLLKKFEIPASILAFDKKPALSMSR